MKKILFTLLAMVMSVTAANAFFDKYTINRDELPETARAMLDEHFPKAKVSMIKVDKHLLKKTDYDVKLTNGTKIEFNNSGKWTSVDCGKRAVPEALVAKAIRNYVTKNYSGSTLVSIAKKNIGYDVGLSCGRVLRFNAIYQFKGEKTPGADDETETDDSNDSDTSEN